MPVVGAPFRADVDADVDDGTVEYLRDAGDHPLMYSFPQGAVFAFDRDLRYLSAGGLGLADVGLSRELLEGHTIFEVFPEETAATIEPFYRAALAGESTTWDVPFGGRTYAQRLAPVTTPDGVVVAGLGFTQDVTEAREAERALRESDERNRLTFEHAPIGQAIVELDGSWRQVNSAVTRLTEYSEEELLAKTFQDITHPDDLDLDLGQMNRLLAAEISSYQIEKRYITATGRIVWVLLSVALVRDEEGSPLYFISQIQDITDRKRQEQALRDLTAMLAHDLRTPTTVLRGFAELLEGPAAGGRGRGPRLRRQNRHGGSLPDRPARERAGGYHPRCRTPGRDPEVGARRRCGPERNAGVAMGEVAVEAAVPDDLAVWVDPVHFNQVLTNLLTNAAKYGGDVVTISVEHSIADPRFGGRQRFWRGNGLRAATLRAIQSGSPGPGRKPPR